jgi:RNA polymerase sigma-70 factor (ECF subfamily)
VSTRGQRDSLEERENLFVQGYSFARRAAQVHAAGIAGLDLVLLGREDLAQEVSLRLWCALREYDASRASLRTYTERIVDRHVASLLRRRKAKKRTRDDDMDLPASSIELLVRIELRADIDRAFIDLGRLDLRVARLLLQDYKPAEVARKLGIPRTTVYRSIDRMRTALSRAGYG